MKKFNIISPTSKRRRKTKNAPDSQYQIGVLIGSFIPFLVLVAFSVYFILQSKKKKKKNLNN